MEISVQISSVKIRMSPQKLLYSHFWLIVHHAGQSKTLKEECVCRQQVMNKYHENLPTIINSNFLATEQRAEDKRVTESEVHEITLWLSFSCVCELIPFPLPPLVFGGL